MPAARRAPRAASATGAAEEAPGGFEPPNGGFADLCLTTWLRRRYEGGAAVGRRPPEAVGGASRPHQRRHRVAAGLPVSRAGNRTRTGDPHLGKVVLYQLSYSRVAAPLFQGAGPSRGNSAQGHAVRRDSNVRDGARECQPRGGAWPGAPTGGGRVLARNGPCYLVSASAFFPDEPCSVTARQPSRSSPSS